MSIKEKLRKQIKTTSYAKFDASKRFAMLNNYSLFSLTSASLLLIFVSLVSTFSNPLCPIIGGPLIELFQIMTSIVIAVLSVVVSFASYSLKCERFLNFGNRMMDLVDELKFVDESDHQRISNINYRYASLRKNVDNHSAFNYEYGRRERKKEESNESVEIKAINRLRYWMPIVSFALISLFSIISAIVLVFICVNHYA